MRTHIDLTSLLGVQMALTAGATNDWALTCLREVTVLSMLQQHVRIPPPPTEVRAAGGPLAPVQEVFKTRPRFPQGAREAAQAAATEILRATGFPGAVRSTLQWLQNHSAFAEWLAWHSDNELTEHVIRLNGLVEEPNVALVAKVLGVTSNAVNELNRQAVEDPQSTVARLDDMMIRMYVSTP